MKNIFALIAFFFSFIVQAQEKYSLADVPLELMKNANSVLLDEKVEVDVSENGKLTYSYFGARAVLNKRGDKAVSNRVYYDKDTHVGKLEAYVFDSFGNELEHFRKKDYYDVSASDGISIYSDNRMYYLDYTPTTYPYIIVINYEYKSNSTAFVPGWSPVGWYARSTKKSTYKIKFDPNNKPRIKSENLDGIDISILENSNEYIYTAININAFVYEDLSVPFNKKAPKVYFSLNNFTLKGVSGNAKNWMELGNWMQNRLLNNVSEIPAPTIVEINNLVRNETSNEAKARIVYNYMQEKVRYISVQIGIGGWKPMLASDVDKLSYGDCKALTNYTKALLDAVDVPSYYTILYAGSNKKDIKKEFSGIQGNHAILGIPDGENITWLECTSQDSPYGFIGDFCDDRDVLIVTPEGGKIVRTKNYSYEENLEETFVEVNINRKGGAKASYKSISRGLQYGDKYRFENEKQEDINKIYKNKWDAINGYTIDSLKLTNNREEILFIEDIKIDIPTYCISVGEDILVNVNLFNQNNNIPTRIKDREYDLDISRGFEDRNTINITIPQGYKIGDLPEDTLIENKFGTYAVNYKLVSENKLEYKRNLIIKKGTFPKEEYRNYRAFRRKISKLDKTKIIVIKNS